MPLLGGVQLQRRPQGAVPLRPFGGVELQALQQLGVELRLDRADRDELAVARRIGVVPGCARVEPVGTACFAPLARGEEAGEHRRQQRGAVDHRRIDDLAAAAPARLDQAAGDAERQEHAAAAEVADEIERRHRRFVGAADGVQHAGQR